MVVGGNPQFLHDRAARIRAEAQSEAQACAEFERGLSLGEAACGDDEVSAALADLRSLLAPSAGLAVELVQGAGTALEINAQALERAFGGGAE